MGGVEVRAVVEEGYIISDCEFENGKCSYTSSTYDGISYTATTLETGSGCTLVSGKNYFCKQKVNRQPSDAVSFKLASCTTTTCKDSGITYTGCVNGVCKNTQVGTASALTYKDPVSGFNCGVTDLGKTDNGDDKYSLNCTDSSGNKANNNNPVCIAYRPGENETDELKVSCKPSAIAFRGNNATESAAIWEVDGGVVFMTKTGSIFITKDWWGNGINGACGNSGFGIFSPNANFLGANTFFASVNKYYDCPIDNLETLIKNLKEKDWKGRFKPAAFDGIISNIGLREATITEIKECKDVPTADATSYKQKKDKLDAELKKAGKEIPTDGTLQECKGGLLTYKKKDGTSVAVGADGKVAEYSATGQIISTTSTATGDGDPLKKAGAGLGFLVNILLLFISAVVFVLAYLFGWLGLTVLWLFGYIFLTVLRINPVGANFINVAADPWRIVVGIANMLVLSTFIFVGFGYILDIAKLKVKLEEFFLNIVIFTLVLNFTLLGSAAIVNVTQGIGEVMVGSYAIGEPDPEKANFALIGGLIQGISRVSAVRCGNVTSLIGSGANAINEKMGSADGLKEIAEQTRECNGGLVAAAGQTSNLLQAYDPTQLFGANLTINGRAGNLITLTMLEIVFCLLVFFAIMNFWKAIYLVIGRTTGLWLLIVLSPLALAAYISPIQSLKKYGSQWLDHFWKWCLFYPAFIFGLILINVMSKSFSDAFTEQVTTLIANENGGVKANAFFGQIAGGSSTAFLIFAVIGFALPMAVFGIMIEWFAKSFEAIAKAALGAVKQGWDVIKGGSGAIGAGMGGVAKLIGKTEAGKAAGERLKSIRQTFDNIKPVGGIKSVENKIAAQDTIIGRTGSTPAEIAAAEKEKGRLELIKKDRVAKRDAYQGGLGLGTVGNFIASAPIVAESRYEDMKYNLWDKNTNNVKAVQSAAKTNTKLKIEYGRRKNATGEEIEALDAANPNSPLAGIDKDDIAEMEAKDPNYFQKIIRSATEQARQNSLGLDKIGVKNIKSYRLKAQKFLDKYGNDYERMVKDGKKYEFLRLVNAAKNDSVLNNILFNNDFGTELVRQARGDIEQSSNGPEITKWLNETQPKTLEDENARFDEGAEIGRQYNRNPTAYKFPDGIDDPFIMAGIESTMEKDPYKKKFGDKPYTIDNLKSTGQKIQYKARNGAVGYAGLRLNEDEEVISEAADRVIAKSGFRGDVAKAISEAPAGSNVDDIISDLKEQEFGTAESGEDEASLERGITEIANKTTAAQLLADSKIAARIKSKTPRLKALLESGDADKEAIGLKLLKIGVIKAFSNAKGIYFENQKGIGEDFKKGMVSGNRVAAPHTYASSQLDEVKTFVDPADGQRKTRSLEQIQAILQADENRHISSALGLSKVANVINFAKNKRQNMSPDIGIKTGAFVNIEAGKAAALQEGLNYAIAETVKEGITPDGRFVNDAPLRDFVRDFERANPENTGIITNYDTLSKKIQSDGVKYLQSLNNSAAEGNLTQTLENEQDKIDQNADNSVLGALTELKKENEDFVSGSDTRAKGLIDANTLNVPVVAPTPPPPVDPAITFRNNIVAFNRANPGKRIIATDTRPDYGALTDGRERYLDSSGNIIRDLRGDPITDPTDPRVHYEFGAAPARP